jgi:regulator of protease activity HflC (stomatin/prohibitin superfamily)
MKKALLTACVLLSLATCDKVPVGSVGVKVSTLGDNKGVATEVLGTGWYWVGFTQTLFSFPTFMQTHKWEGKDEFQFQTVEGLIVGAPISLSYSVEPSKVPTLFQTYRKGLEEITEIYIHNIIRDNLVLVGSTRTIDQIYGAGKAQLLVDLQKAVIAKLEPIGIHVDQVSIVGGFRLPPSVVESINLKIQATQQAQQRENEVATAMAEAQKAVAVAKGAADSRLITAQAEAQANIIVSKSISEELIRYTAIGKWDGKLPETLASETVPFLSLQQKGK